MNDAKKEPQEIEKASTKATIVSVIPFGPFDTPFTYLYDNSESHADIEIGDVVDIPFGRQRSTIGVVVNKDFSPPSGVELKRISQKYALNIEQDYLDFMNWVASYNLIPCGMVLKMILCEKSVFNFIERKKSEGKRAKDVEEPLKPAFNEEIVLTSEQQDAYSKIIEASNCKNPKPFLLQGVTGSGKTEIYLAVIREIINKGQQALIMLPEIALTSQLAARIEKYFGFPAIIWNSGVTPRRRRDLWIKAISGEKCIVIGTRSALFLPFKNLGIIVVDEEHDSSYKQEEGGFYNARDMAIVLAHIKKIPVILASATPSLESYVNAKIQKYEYALVKSRFGSAKPASISLIDMRQCKFENDFISRNLLNAIQKTLERNEQVLIYLNRRGYSPLTLCKSCGEKVVCPNCTSWLVYHKNIDILVCHYCGHKINIPKKCSSCGTENSFIQFGPGIERIHEEISRKVPSARIFLASSDSVSSEKKLIEMHNKIFNGEIDIIIGTQILAKGHHFPNLTLVGIVDGDLGLNCADLRSSEKTYQLIQQVGGRAGRAEKPGRILIQTFNPQHSLYKALNSDDATKFIDIELASRKENNLPPFSRFAAVIVSGTNKALVEKTAQKLVDNFPRNEVSIFGPAPAPLFLLRGRTRWRILLKSSKKIALSKVIRDWISSQNTAKNIKIQVDIDPVSFL